MDSWIALEDERLCYTAESNCFFNWELVAESLNSTRRGKTRHSPESCWTRWLYLQKSGQVRERRESISDATEGKNEFKKNVKKPIFTAKPIGFQKEGRKKFSKPISLPVALRRATERRDTKISIFLH